jgi:hypothetical protein
MAKTKERDRQKLNLKATLDAIDTKKLSYYDSLSAEEKKLYVPFVLMRYMSSLTDQNSMGSYAVLAANDLVNLGFFAIGEHPELQHMLLCLSGTGRPQYRPYIGSKLSKKTTGVIDQFFLTLYPGANNIELKILKSNLTVDRLRTWAEDAGCSKQEIKDLVEDAKKLERDS